MPVTKTAKRALKGSKRKQEVNKKIVSALEIAVRVAKRTKKQKDVSKAESLADRAKKKKVIHQNKASRIKSSLNRLLPQKKSVAPKAKSKKTPKKK